MNEERNENLMSILSAAKIAPSTVPIKCKAALNTGFLSHSHELFDRLAYLRCSSNIVDGPLTWTSSL